MSEAPRSLVLQAIPVLGALAWLAAVGIALTLINPWLPGDGGVHLYGWTAPDAFVVMLLFLSVACAAMAVWKRHLVWPYAAAALIVPLGTGTKGLVGSTILSGDLLPLLAFAAALFLLVEYLSAMPRFQEIVDSTAGLDKTEARPVTGFLGRYLVASVLLSVVYLVALGLWVQTLVPAIASTFSPRVADGVENRTALGVITFTGLLLGLLFLGRVAFDGIRDLRTPEQEDDEADILDLRPVSVGKELHP